MIPFAIPRDRHVINLFQVCRVDQLSDGTLEVQFSNGTSELYTGEEAEIVNTEIRFILNMFRQMQAAAQSQIVTPDSPTGRIM